MEKSNRFLQKVLSSFPFFLCHAFTGDNQWIAGYFENQVQVLSTEDGELELGIDFPLGDGQMSNDPVMIFSFSDDSTLLAIGNNNSGEITGLGYHKENNGSILQVA